MSDAMGYKVDVPEKYFDRLFAPSSCLAIITTVDVEGRANAATFGTCTRVNHNPVYIAFTTTLGNHTADNVISTGEFVVNLPAFDRDMLEKASIVALPFDKGINELAKAGLDSIPGVKMRPPRVLQCPRHFECRVEWTKEWSGDRLMVCGRVMAASANADCIDAKGYVIWDRVKSAHYCGAPYGHLFVKAFETMAVDVPYTGEELEAFEKLRRSFFEDM